MDSQKNLVFVALKSMESDSIKAGDKVMERCIKGCIKSLGATTKIVSELEDLQIVQGFTKVMLMRIKDKFEKGPLRCECGKKSKNLKDFTGHIKIHQRKKPSKTSKRIPEKPEVEDLSNLVLPTKGTAAFAVMMALNGENIRLTKVELQLKAQKHTKTNLTMNGNQLKEFKTTWYQIESLVGSGLLKKESTPVLYFLSAKGLRALRLYETTSNLCRDIPQDHRDHLNLDDNKVIRRILGNGTCLYGCASYFLNGSENVEMTKDLRRRAHKFLKNSWADLDGHADLLFPTELMIAGEVEKVSISSVAEWLGFLQTEKSLFAYTEFEVETQSLANFLNITIEVFNFSSAYQYLTTYTPTPEIAVRSPFRDFLGSSSSSMIVYHEIDSHFEIIVNRR